MRIAVYHNQPSGGARRALLGFCRYLHRRHQIDLFTLTTADQAMLADDDVVDRLVRLPYRPRRPIRFGLYLNDLIQRRNLRDLERVNRAAAEQIDAGGYDAVLVDCDRFTFAPFILKYLRTPALHYVHHRPWVPGKRFAPAPMSRYEWLRALWHGPLERRLLRERWRQEVALIGCATRIATNSRFTAERLRTIYGVRASVIACGVDLPPAWGCGGDGYVLSVGELEVRKGFNFVIAGLAQVPERIRPPLLVVANGGNPRVRQQLERQAQQLGVNLRISVLPSQPELSRAYRNAEIFLYGAYEEALGLAPLEAMAHRVPVVAVGEGGVLETVQHGRTGFLTAREPVEFGERIRELLKYPSLRSGMAGAARAEIAQAWTWEVRGPALERELEAALQTPSPTLATSNRELASVR